MISPENIILICWIIFLLYWFINWWKVKPTQETKWKEPSNRWTILWIIILFLLLTFTEFLHSSLFSMRHLWSSSKILFPALQIPGDILTIIGLFIAIIARKTLADNWSSNVELKKNHKLITTGIYAYTRHPIYTGVLLMGLGFVLVEQSIPLLLFFAIMIWFLMFKLKKEEQLLAKHFPKDYTEYMKKTKALIPFIY